jgi:chromosome transmission fidelity protein 4
VELSFSAATERKKEKNNYWVVGLNTAQVYCIVCKAPETQPQVVPKPVMGVINITVPVVHSDLGADDLESNFLSGTLHLTHVSNCLDLPFTLIYILQ